VEGNTSRGVECGDVFDGDESGGMALVSTALGPGVLALEREYPSGRKDAYRLRAQQFFGAARNHGMGRPVPC
jgi:hypothetical protein